MSSSTSADPRSKLDALRAFYGKTSFLVPWILAVIYTGLIGIMATHHEMWRDEMQAWLLARDSTSPLALLHNMQYEGHPGLWHMILWPIAQLTWNPAGMQVAHVLIAGSSAFLLLRFSPFSLPVKILILCGYFFSYEWSVIARNYAISVLLLFGICALFKDRWRNILYMASLFFLLCHTNIHSIIMTIVMITFIMIEFAVAYAAKARDAHRYLPRVALGLLIVIIGILTGAKQTAPPTDSGFATDWYYKWTDQRRQATAEKIIRSQIPLPAEKLSFWNSNRLLEQPNLKDGEEASFSIPPEKRLKYGLALLLCLAIPFFKRPWPGLAYICTSFALLAFFYIKYPGAIRHHGFLYLSLLTALWISHDYTPWHLPWRIPEMTLAFVDKYRVVMLLPLFAIHAWSGYEAIRHDWKDTFSVAKETAAWLNEEFPDHDTVIFAGEWGAATSPIVGFLQLKQIYYLERGEFGSYVIWDNKRNKHPHSELTSSLPELMRETGKDAVIIAQQTLREARLRKDLRLLHRFNGGIVESEDNYVYLLENITPTGASNSQ